MPSADRVVDALRSVGVERAGDREHQVAALGHRGVGNRDHRLVVVDDGAGGNRVAEHRRAWVAPCGFVSVTVTVSLVSSMMSPTVATVMVFDSSPGAKVTVPRERAAEVAELRPCRALTV